MQSMTFVWAEPSTWKLWWLEGQFMLRDAEGEESNGRRGWLLMPIRSQSTESETFIDHLQFVKHHMKGCTNKEEGIKKNKVCFQEKLRLLLTAARAYEWSTALPVFLCRGLTLEFPCLPTIQFLSLACALGTAHQRSGLFFTCLTCAWKIFQFCILKYLVILRV